MPKLQPPAVASTFDVVYWFIDQALNDAEYLRPLKLQRLLFMAQSYYAVSNKGRRLMPAIFIAHETGPVEPNIFRLFESEQRPYIDARMVNGEVEEFLMNIWRRFGPHSGEHLTRTIMQHPPFLDAYANAPGTEITLISMVKYYGTKRSDSKARASGAPNVDQVVRPKVLRTQDGKNVTVQSWMPKKRG